MLLRKFTVSDIVKRLDEYTARNISGLPILEECCLLNGWDYEEFDRIRSTNDRIKRAAARLLCQKRVNLEKQSIMGSFNKPMSVLLLERLDQVFGGNRTLATLESLDRLLSADEAYARSLPADGGDDGAADRRDPD
jgi:hypothetical protein